MDGIGHVKISWRGNEHYEGTYNFKGVMEGQPQRNVQPLQRRFREK